MKESHYKSYDDLPLFLNAEMTARVMGVSPSSGYERIHELGFPVLCRRPHGGAQGAVHPVGERSHRRRQLKRSSYRDGFFLPNELFQLGLDYGELAVYSFLKQCQNRRTYPQHQDNWESGGMSGNTARKYICQLEEQSLIVLEPTEISTKIGEKAQWKSAVFPPVYRRGN